MITISNDADLTDIKTAQLTVSVTDSATNPHTLQAGFSATVHRASRWRHPARRARLFLI